MKIVCDACQAKYSISDDKVQGKVFKIRCKKCSNIIVVRGGAGAAEAAPAPAAEKDHRVYDYGYDAGAPPAADDAIWHVVINQDQVGPMTPGEVEQRLGAGEIDVESYVWREGFADWLPLAQVDVFAHLASSAPAATAAPSGMSAMFGSSAGNDESGTMRSDPGDLFAAASAGSHAQQDDDAGDLFGSKPAAASASAAANAKLRGERNENSVLFSLNNLAQLASDRPAPAAAAPTSSGGSSPSMQAAGGGGGEGSGLIDIRSMATAYMGGSAGAAKPATASAIGSIDDLPVFGGGGFSEPAVIVPTARPANNNKVLYALIGGVGLLAVIAVIMVVMLVSKKDDNKKTDGDQVAMGDKDKDKTGDKDKPSGEDKPADKPADKPSDSPADKPTDKPTDTASTDKPTDKPADKPADKTPPPVVAKKDPPKQQPRNTPPSTPVIKKDPPRDPPKKDVTVAKTPPDNGGSCDEVSCVLNNYEGACCQKFKKGGGSKPAAPTGGTTPPKGASDLPDSLDRAMISDGVGRVKGKVMSCSGGKGTVKVSVKVNPNGSVAGVTVKTTPDPGLGNCVAGAMQRATFAKTQNGGSFGYPFMFN